MANPQQWCFEL